MAPEVKLARRLLVQWDMYHPSWYGEVAEARYQLIPIVIFPALLRVDKFPAKSQYVQFFKDICRARATPCDACVRAKRMCIIHNLSSYRCFDCWVQGWGRCSWEEYMIGCGYVNPPSCLPYEAVDELDVDKGDKLIIVPAGAVWGDRTSQPLSLLSQPIVQDVVDDDEELEEFFYDSLEFGSDSSSERGDQAEAAKEDASSSEEDHEHDGGSEDVIMADCA